MIPRSRALPAYLTALAGDEPASSLIEVRPLDPDGRPARERTFLPIGRMADVQRLVVELAPRLNVFVGVAPRVRAEGNATAVARVWTLWADIDSAGALEAVRAFRPLPSIVMRTGSGGGHVYWPLSEPLSPPNAQRANRRLAQALGGDMHATDPARILRPPRTFNHKHTPPREVICTRLASQAFVAREVVSELPDSPHYAPRRPQASSDHAHDPDRILDGLVRTVRDAQVGNRNHALFWSVCRMAERANELDTRRALDELRMAALEIGLSEHEIRATILSGLRHGGAVAA